MERGGFLVGCHIALGRPILHVPRFALSGPFQLVRETVLFGNYGYEVGDCIGPDFGGEGLAGVCWKR